VHDFCKGHQNGLNSAIVNKHGQNEKDLRRLIHSTLEEVTSAVNETRAFHVAIASLIKMTHSLEAVDPNERGDVFKEGVDYLVRMIAPFAPCVASEMWLQLQKSGTVSSTKTTVFNAGWPKLDQSALLLDTIETIIMVRSLSYSIFCN
jgi:leucyl-tRNA synthetase